MKNIYRKPELEVVFIEENDSIRTSGENDFDNVGNDIFEEIFI